MLRNRSVPTDVLLPHITYQDVAAALAWLSSTFGFVEHYRYGEPSAPDGAQMHLGDAWIMLSSPRPVGTTPARQLGQHTQSLTVIVEDVDAQYERVKSAGATITEELNETACGERQFGVSDLDGHPWLFSTHVRDVSPDEWGATVASEDRPGE